MQLNSRILLFLCLVMASCVDRFIPDTTGYNGVLFIECLISDDTTGQPAVKISFSAPVATEAGGKITYQPEGVSGADVRLNCSDGNVFSCSETLKGVYPLPPGFTAESGKSYRLTVNYGGNVFESDIQKLNPSPPIDSISWKAITIKQSEAGPVIEGYRFYASTRQSGQGPFYYRWSVDAAFRYEVPYDATHIWNGRKTIPASNRLYKTCWKSKDITGIYVATTAGLVENKVIEAPLNFESQYGDELTIRYSLRVRQYNISESALTFWKNIQKLISETGSLYETQPFRITGNIRCTNDPAVYVAGIFELAGISTRRIFVDKPTEFQVVPVECILMPVGVPDFPWYRLPAGSYVTQNGTTGQFLTASPMCYDCRLRDGSLDKPPFWEDK